MKAWHRGTSWFHCACIVLLSLSPAPVSARSLDYTFASRGSVDAVYHLVNRVIGGDATDRLELELIQNAESGWVELSDSSDGIRVKVTAASGPDLTYGVAMYLREHYAMSFSWDRAGGHHITPEFLKSFDANNNPSVRKVGQKKNYTRGSTISYFNNVVTFSYSYVWYGVQEWEYLIDWMALSGINLAIAYTGQEEIWRKTFNAYGVSDKAFSSWCNSLPYSAWGRGQNLHGCGGGLPLKVMLSQWELQKQILKRMRDLGIVPVLPAFQGNLPGLFKEIFPQANMSTSGITWLDGTDPLFQDIQKTYMEIMIEDWGTDHWYETDGYFNHASEPWLHKTDKDVDIGNPNCRYQVDPLWKSQGQEKSSSEGPFMSARHINPKRPWDQVSPDASAQAHSSAVFHSLSSVDSEAIWLYQGWIWRGFGPDRQSYMKGFVSGVPNGRLVILDMFDEVDSEWDKFSDFAYFDTPFIWSVLHNFGGNTGMWGSLEILNNQPFQALKHTNSMVGTGGAPEGIDQNPLYYTFLSDIHWRTTSFPSIVDQVKILLHGRYGVEVSDPRLSSIAHGLLSSVYNHANNVKLAASRNWLSEKNSNGVTSLAYGGAMNTPKPAWFNRTELIGVWQSLLSVAKQGNMSRPLRYDIVNTGREVLASLSDSLFEQMVDEAAPLAQRQIAGNELFLLTLDMDELLCYEQSFLTSAWLGMASKLAMTIDPQDDELREDILFQARSHTTTWGPQLPSSKRPDSTNLDYGNKQWSGQLSGFYAERHKCFLTHMESRPDFEKCVVNASVAWTTGSYESSHPSCQGNERSQGLLDKSQALLHEWFANLSPTIFHATEALS